MPKHPIDDTLLDEENNVQVTIEKARYNKCCINKNVFAIICTILCIVLIISGLTCINIYAIYREDGSL